MTRGSRTKLGELGLATQKAGYGSELAGVPKSVIDKFSRRRNEIEEKAAKAGIVSPEGKHAIGYYGRENKTRNVGKAELRREWESRLTTEERAALLSVMSGEGAGDSPLDADQAMAYAMEHCFER